MPIDDDAVGIVKWGTGAGASNFNTPADVGFAEADGWPLAYGTPGSGSEPQREVFNWQWRRMTALAVELLTHGGGLPWDSRISYLHPASVMGSDGMLYQSVQDSTNQDPTTDASDTHWQQVGITLSDADIKTAYERNADTNALTDALLALLQGAAPLASPAFTGAVTVPDQTAGTNNGRAANTRFVAAALAALVASAPSTLDTLNELAAALGDDANFAATVTTQLGLKADATDVQIATKAQAEAGTNNSTVMTPLRTLQSIRRNALSGPKVILYNTENGFATGGTGNQQGLTIPSLTNAKWLDASKIDVASFAPLDGCSAVTGGVHFDWSDAGIPSVEAQILAVNEGDPVALIPNTPSNFRIATTGNWMSDDDWALISSSFARAGELGSSAGLAWRSKPLTIPRNSYLLIAYDDTADDNNLLVEVEILAFN